MMDVYWSISDGLDVGASQGRPPLNNGYCAVICTGLMRLSVAFVAVNVGGDAVSGAGKNETDISSLLSWRGHLSLGYDKTFIMEKKDDG
ncbi:hypothetical protein [Lonsdalea quercina]|uniref:hypothetical protein n=1 Tax=Lonsdalea quercina TaxID=71657 RepID=UPI0039759BED